MNLERLAQKIGEIRVNRREFGVVGLGVAAEFMNACTQAQPSAEESQLPPTQIKEAMKHRKDVLSVIQDTVSPRYAQKGIKLLEPPQTGEENIYRFWLKTNEGRYVGIGGPAPDGVRAQETVIIVNTYREDNMTLKESIVVTDMQSKTAMADVLNENGTIRDNLSTERYTQAAQEAVKDFFQLPPDIQFEDIVQQVNKKDEHIIVGQGRYSDGRSIQIHIDKAIAKLTITYPTRIQ